MIRKSKITTLAELKRRKKQVRMETEIAKREFAHTLGTTKGNAGDYLLKKVALPTGGAVVGLLLLSKLISSSGDSEPVIKETKVIHEYPDGTPYVEGRRKGGKRSRLKQLTAMLGALRILMPVVQAVIGAYHSHKAKEAARTAKTAARTK